MFLKQIVRLFCLCHTVISKIFSVNTCSEICLMAQSMYRSDHDIFAYQLKHVTNDSDPSLLCQLLHC